MDELVPKYKIGDIVQLNSGGYKMTINAVMKHNSLQKLIPEFIGYYECCYTDDIEKVGGCLKLHEDALILIKTK
jgi:uncharacterized protein YodC (DUF2158 family)